LKFSLLFCREINDRKGYLRRKTNYSKALYFCYMDKKSI